MSGRTLELDAEPWDTIEALKARFKTLMELLMISRG